MDALLPPHVTSDPEVLGGTPVLAGTRLPVETLLACVAAGTPWERLLESWPWLTPEHVAAAARFAQTHDTGVRPWNLAGIRPRDIHPDFATHLDSLAPSFERLMASVPFRFADLPHVQLPNAGVYVFSESDTHMYVGRSNSIRRRLQNHCRPGSKENQAAFAFLLARRETGSLKASYRPDGSRRHLMTQETFRTVFDAQKARLRAMDIRVVEETNPNRQALLEMYVSIALKTLHNDFDNH